MMFPFENASPRGAEDFISRLTLELLAGRNEDESMRMICITHAAGQRTRKDLFSGLTDEGREHVTEAARRFRCKSENTNMKITKILSSPHARCIETVLFFAREVSGYTPSEPDGYPQVNAEIQTCDQLREETITAEVLQDIAVKTASDTVLLGTHNNLFTVLPDTARNALKEWIDEEKYFKPRPVVVSLSYAEGTWELLYWAVCIPSQWKEWSS
jgi:phosphohistidine phosphatase SixA